MASAGPDWRTAAARVLAPLGRQLVEGRQRRPVRSSPDESAPDAFALAEDPHGQLRTVGLRTEDRRYGTAITGGPGKGKTSVLTLLGAADAQVRERALIAFDPKGDFALKLLSLIPPDRRVWYLDLTRPEFGLNCLCGDTSPSSRADTLVSVIRDVNPDLAVQASSDRFLRLSALAIIALAEHEGRDPSFWDLYRLLQPHEDEFRNYAIRVTRYGHDMEGVHRFWAESFPAFYAANPAQTAMKSESPLNKLERWIMDPGMDRALHHPLKLSIDGVIARREMLIINGNMGELGSSNTVHIMQMVMRTVAGAIHRQQAKSRAQRVDVSYMIDEAHYIMNKAFGELLAVGRSAGLLPTAAWQHTAQIEDERVAADTVNLLQTRLMFGTGDFRDAETLLAPTKQMVSGRARTEEIAERFTGPVSESDLLYLPKHYFVGSQLVDGARREPYIGHTLAATESPALIRQHLFSQRERGAFYPYRLPSRYAPIPGLETPEDGFGQGVGTQPAGEPAREAITELVTPPSAPTGASASDGAGVGEPSLPESDEGVPVAPAAAVDGPVVSDTPQTTAPAPAPKDDGARSSALTRMQGRQHPADEVDAAAVGTPLVPIPASYAELRWEKEDGGVRTFPKITAPKDLEPGGLDQRSRAILAIAHRTGIIYGPQLQRLFWPDASRQAAQKKLSSLYRSGVLTRFLVASGPGQQPFSYKVTEAGFRLVKRAPENEEGRWVAPGETWRDSYESVGQAKSILHDLRVTGWVLALYSGARDYNPHFTARPAGAYFYPPKTRRGRERVPLKAGDCGIVGLHQEDRPLAEVKPDALVELVVDGRTLSLLVELQRRTKDPANESFRFKLRSYDGFHAGWYMRHPRFESGRLPAPWTVFVCEDAHALDRTMQVADHYLTAAIGKPGEPQDMLTYPSRERTLFVCELDAHQGTLRGLRLPPLPAEVRKKTGRAAEAEWRRHVLIPRKDLHVR